MQEESIKKEVREVAVAKQENEVQAARIVSDRAEIDGYKAEVAAYEAKVNARAEEMKKFTLGI